MTIGWYSIDGITAFFNSTSAQIARTWEWSQKLRLRRRRWIAMGTQTLARANKNNNSTHRSCDEGGGVEGTTTFLVTRVSSSNTAEREIAPFQIPEPGRSQVTHSVCVVAKKKGEREREKKCRKVFSSTIYAAEKDEQKNSVPVLCESHSITASAHVLRWCELVVVWNVLAWRFCESFW